ncbi:tyrosine-type recombinase/integrase [Aliivibrio salmonicida]|uniref:tyrosine-type recombinase/integrase n=1 Tax=Aliivibrio salmonicida TaxID=40269 RepID=UPI003D143AC6
MACIKSYPPQNPKELRKILKAVESENITIALMLEFMALTGLRFCDCSPLVFSQVMINGVVRDRVTIVQQKPYNKRIASGATEAVARNASKLDVIFSDQAASVIMDCREFADKGSALLFESSKIKGRPYSAQHVNRILKKVAEKMELKYALSTHSFRKAFAFMLIEDGAGVHHVRDKLGHSSIAVTDHYLRSFMSDSDEFAKNLKF